MAAYKRLTHIWFTQITHQAKWTVLETLFVAALVKRYKLGIDCVQASVGGGPQDGIFRVLDLNGIALYSAEFMLGSTG